MYEDFFAERLSYLRIQKKVSAREMSLALGQNESYINRIENKHTFPSMQIFFYICEYINITPQDFFNTSTVNPIKLQQLIPELGKLNNNQLDIILNITNEFLHH